MTCHKSHTHDLVCVSHMHYLGRCYPRENTSVRLHVCVCIKKKEGVYVHLGVCKYVCLCVRTCVCVFVRVRVCVCV